MKLFTYKDLAFQLIRNNGVSLECYYCSGKTSADCRDPFPEDSNSTRLVNCSTLRTRSLNVLNAYHSMLHDVSSFKPLGPEPHVCYKVYDGDYPLRGCSQNDFCFNQTSTICELCDQDGCNFAQTIYHSQNIVLFISIMFSLF